MKRIFIIALLVLGMYNVSAFAMVQEVVLTELYSIAPLDDANRDTLGERPDPNRFHASIGGNHLFVGAHTDAPAYVEIINEETGEVVAKEEFEGETEMYLPESGDYELYIYSGDGTVMVGEISVE